MPKRKSQKPYVKATNQQMAQRLEQVALWLAVERLTFGQIKKLTKKKWNLEWRQTAEYVTRARAEMLRVAKLTKPDALAEAMMYYDSVIRSKDASWSEKTAAQKRKDELTGIEPVKIVRQQISNETDKPFKVQDVTKPNPFTGMSVEAVRKLMASLPPEAEPVVRNGNGSSNDH